MEKLVEIKEAILKWIADNPKKNVAAAAFGLGVLVGAFLL